MTTLRPITDAKYAAWLQAVVPAYAQDKVAAGQWAASPALALSQQAYARLLPQGRHTAQQHLYTIADPAGHAVGTIWMAEEEQAGRRIGYVYDVLVAPAQRRRGHALRAFRALEQEAARLGLAGIALHVFGHNQAAQALYRKLGYAITDLNLFKPVGGG